MPAVFAVSFRRLAALEFLCFCAKQLQLTDLRFELISISLPWFISALNERLTIILDPLQGKLTVCVLCPVRLTLSNSGKWYLSTVLCIHQSPHPQRKVTQRVSLMSEIFCCLSDVQQILEQLWRKDLFHGIARHTPNKSLQGLFAYQIVPKIVQWLKDALFCRIISTLASRKDRRKKILLNTNRTFRPHGLPQLWMWWLMYAEDGFDEEAREGKTSCLWFNKIIFLRSFLDANKDALSRYSVICCAIFCRGEI